MKVSSRVLWGLGIFFLIGILWEARIHQNGGPLENTGAENIFYNVSIILGLIVFVSGALQALSNWRQPRLQEKQAYHSEDEWREESSVIITERQYSRLYSKACEEIGITMNFSVEEIRAYWRRNCRRWHPDHGGSHDAWIRKKMAYDMLLSWAEYCKELHDSEA